MYVLLQILLFTWPLVVVLLWYFLSTMVENNHLRSLDRREAALADMIVTDLKLPVDAAGIREAHLVQGQAVIGTDLFKSWITGLKSLFGGELGAMQTLLTRARREALIRMLDEARDMGATEVINVRYESSNILSGNPNRKRKGSMCAEIYAYGTAIVRQPDDA